jgi:hypothetical protein
MWRYLFFVLALFFIQACSFAQSANCLYLEFTSKKITTAYYADIYTQQCNAINKKSSFINPQKGPSFIPVYLKCDSVKPVTIRFVIPANYPVCREPYKGDSLFYSGDSILYNADDAGFTVINKNRKGRSGYTDCVCNSPL